MNIWFFSDPHYGHKNICRGTSNWELKEGDQQVRDFDTLEEMNDTIVNNFNSLVKDSDIAYCLGDWSFGGHENIKIFRERLNCKTIHLIFGNHDQHIEPVNSPYRELFATVQYYKEITLKLDRKWKQFTKTKICLSHYAMRVWNKSHHGSLHLYGHSHGTLPDNGTRSMDVGLDTHDLYPYHLDEVLENLLFRDVHIVDHHNSNTN